MSNTECRFCGAELKQQVVDLGLSPVSTAYIRKDKIKNGQRFFPLVANVCGECLFIQAQEFESPENIFDDYLYFSSYSKSWLEHCRAYVSMIVPFLGLGEGSVVTEIACNDGYLLQYFQNTQFLGGGGIFVYGVEPAHTVAAAAREKGIDVVEDFFNDGLAPSLIEKYGKSDLIIGNNVLAHVPDVNGFVKGVKLLLKDTGTANFEFPHFLNLFEQNQFDTIYHEHFSYWTILALQKIFAMHGLKLYKIEQLPTHGGSLRIYAAHEDNVDLKSDGSVARILELERGSGLDKLNTYADFYKRVEKIKRDTLMKLCELKARGKSVAAFGAAAKGNTFLNYCGIRTDMLDYVADDTIEKQGTFTPGTLIPIVSREKLKETKPDYVVILPWNWKDAIVGEIGFIREWGGKFITFIPDTQEF